MKRIVLMLTTWALAACGARSSPAPEPPRAVAELRLGHYVTYRYGGPMADLPVELTKTVTDISERAPRVLQVEVVATRGSEQRRWIEIVRVTDEASQRQALESLYTWNEAAQDYREAPSAELEELYAWTLFWGRHTQPRSRTTSECRFEGEEEPLRCACERGQLEHAGRQLDYQWSECPTIPFGHGPGELRDALTHDIVLQVEVAAHGVVRPVRAQPRRHDQYVQRSLVGNFWR
jgi:hypothetical protein